jgi:hypothetical protein
VNILDWFKNLAGKTQTDQATSNTNLGTTAPKKDRLAFLKSVPTTFDDSGNEVPAEGTTANWDVHKILPLLLTAVAAKAPDTGGALLNSYTIGRQQQLEQQKEDAWKQWQIRANQKRQALEDERYNIEHPVYTVPTVNNVTSNNAADYGQMFTANPQSLNFNLGGFGTSDKLQNQINNFGQPVEQNSNNQLPFLQEMQQTPAQSNAVTVQPQQSIFQPGQKVPLKMFQEQQEKRRQKQEKAAAKQSEIEVYSNYLSKLPQDSRYRGEFENAIKHPEMYDIDSMRKIFYNETAPKQKQIDYSGITFSEKNPYFKIAQNNPKYVTQDIIDKAVKWETDNSQSGYKSQEQGLKLREMGLNLKLSEARLKEINVRTNKILSGDGKGGKGSKTASQEQKDRLNGIAAAAAQYKSSADYIADLKRNSSAFINEFGVTAYNKLVTGAEKLPVWQKIVKKDPKTGKITNGYGQGVAFIPNQSSPLRRFFPNYVSQQQVKTTAQQSIKVKQLKSTDKLNPAITTAIKKAMNGKPEDVAAVAKKYGFKENDLYSWYDKHK